MNNLVSVIFTACNQGELVASTIRNARESLGNTAHEIIIIDDQSIDGCCHGLPSDVLVVRTEYRLGVSKSRRLGAEVARGDTLLWSDPHCIYPEDALARVVNTARHNWAVVLPPTNRHQKDKRTAWGGQIVRNERGLAIGRGAKGAPHPALINTIYCCCRDVYDAFWGWPALPGCWGYSEQAMSLIAWRAGIPVIVADVGVCSHLSYHTDKKLPFFCGTPERAINGHIVHAAFFPETYPTQWQPILESKFGHAAECRKALANEKGEYAQLTTQIETHAVRTERDFLREVFRVPDRNIDADYVNQQAARSSDMGFAVSNGRLRKPLDWFANKMPGCIKGRSVLDVGTRDGKFLEHCHDKNVRHAEGVELLPEAVKRGRSKGRIVRTGDMRRLTDPCGAWDLVTCVHTLEHVPDPDAGVSEMVRVLRPGGWLLLVVPRQERPDPDLGHNSAFPDSAALKTLVSECAGLDPSTCLARADRPDLMSPEIMLAIRKRS